MSYILNILYFGDVGMADKKKEIIDNREFQSLYEKSKNLIDSARNNMG